MTVALDRTKSAATERETRPARSSRVTLAVGLSVAALVVSGISLAGWAQTSAERQQVELRLACLELPGPNDCGQDGE